MQLVSFSKFSLAIICLSSIAFSTHSQETSASDSLKPILGSLQSYRASFVQLIQDAEGETLQQSEGLMSLKKPNMLRWEVSLPDASLFVADGLVIYNLDPFVEQVTLLDQADIVNNNPLMLLISDDTEAWDKVDISYENGEYWLKSNDENANISLLKLRFVEGVLQSLHSVDRQQQSNIIEFSSIQHNLNIADSAFRVDIPESYIVDDQRKSAAQP
ncbi:outer membrane lipoprotein chaperone LolA [Glaciecola sp. SC05]|uniref:outer membrane lipoprotein chaperone LolA n=1 Tax=Glaciecola sp. SC05 TaxID=1987355 RepID=UPI003528F86C